MSAQAAAPAGYNFEAKPKPVQPKAKYRNENPPPSSTRAYLMSFLGKLH